MKYFLGFFMDYFVKTIFFISLAAFIGCAMHPKTTINLELDNVDHKAFMSMYEEIEGTILRQLQFAVVPFNENGRKSLRLDKDGYLQSKLRLKEDEDIIINLKGSQNGGQIIIEYTEKSRREQEGYSVLGQKKYNQLLKVINAQFTKVTILPN
jgi:hypothetical protein